MRDDPSLAGKPVAVGDLKMISTANYEARKYFVRSAMPGFIGQKLCPSLVFVKPNFDKYRIVADQTREIFREFDPLFEAMSMDEAYLDVTQFLASHPEMTADQVASQIRGRIFEATKLTASAGVACNAPLAKMCSEVNKPNGQFVLPSDKDQILAFVAALPIRKVSGIGRVGEKYLKAFSIDTCADILAKADTVLKLFSHWEFFINIALGIGRNVHEASEGRKSFSCDRTFEHPLTKEADLLARLSDIAASLADDCADERLQAKTVRLS
jgi:DNA polymerase kappa